MAAQYNRQNRPDKSADCLKDKFRLEFHPTVKPTAMCADAILDLTNHGDIVLDRFIGSGSTQIACQRSGRRCFGIELDPRYVDVVAQRYFESFGQQAILQATGETFQQLTDRRRMERK